MIEKIIAFFVWLCVSSVLWTAAVSGWHNAIRPPTYMQDEYVWRIAGAAIIGTLFPFISIAALVAQISWWLHATR